MLVQLRLHNRMILTRANSALLLCCSLLLGCSAILKPARSAAHLTGETTVAPAITADANGNSPIAVDFVTVRGTVLLKEVSKLTAQAWYQQKTTLVRLHPADLTVSSWEWVPGEQVAAVKIPGTAVADGVLLFARYGTPGDHSALLPNSKTVAIEFGADDFKLMPKP
jgi:type VI secretion system protein